MFPILSILVSKTHLPGCWNGASSRSPLLQPTDLQRQDMLPASFPKVATECQQRDSNLMPGCQQFDSGYYLLFAARSVLSFPRLDSDRLILFESQDGSVFWCLGAMMSSRPCHHVCVQLLIPVDALQKSILEDLRNCWRFTVKIVSIWPIVRASFSGALRMPATCQRCRWHGKLAAWTPALRTLAFFGISWKYFQQETDGLSINGTFSAVNKSTTLTCTNLRR